MINPFKQEEKKPYTYSSIEMRKSPRINIRWIIAGLVILLLLIIALLKLI